MIPNKTLNPIVTAFLHEPTGSLTSVVRDPEGPRCAVIDPVLDYDNEGSRTSTASIDPVIAFIRERGLTVEWILETHAHADRKCYEQAIRSFTAPFEG